MDDDAVKEPLEDINNQRLAEPSSSSVHEAVHASGNTAAPIETVDLTTSQELPF